MRRSRLLPRHLLVASLWVLSVSACSPPPAGHQLHYLTREGAGSYTVAAEGPSAVFSSPAVGGGGNTRAFLWRDDAPAAVDQQACASFADSGFPAQGGVVLRASVRPDGSVRGVTVMRNVVFGVTWSFNVSVWDTRRPGLPVHLVAAVDLRSQFGTSWAPWSLCAKVVGDVVSFKAWPRGTAEPGWDSPGRHDVVLPAGWASPGRPGVYAGHVAAGGWLRAEGVQVSEVHPPA